MYAVEMLGSYITRGVYTVSGPFHPFGGAVDIIVVEQPDGSFKSSPWYVRFGKFQGVLKTREKVVNVSVNGVEAKFHMYLNHKGEAYFLREVDDREEDSMRGDYDSKNFAAFDGIEKSNSRVMGRTSSGRSRLLRLVFGRNSTDEDGMGRADSLERAEFAANLLEVKWSTNLSSDPKILKDNGVNSSALSKLDGNDARNVNICDGEINESSSLRVNANTGRESNYLDQKPRNGVDSIVENGAVEASMIGEEGSGGTPEIVYETARQIDEVIVETTEQIANNSSESYGSWSLIKSDGVDSFDYLEISESSALKGDDSMNTELSIKETIIEYGKDLDSSLRSDSRVQISIVEQISDSIEGVSKIMEEEDSIFTSGSRESFGDRMLAKTVNSYEEQFLFSDLDVLENTKVHPLDSSFLDFLKKENEESNIENYNLSTEEPKNLIKTTSFPIMIPKTNQVDVDHSVGSLPGSWPSTSKAVESDFNYSLSRSLDSSLRSINCREIEVEASCGTSDGNEEKKSAEQPLNTEDVQIFLSPGVVDGDLFGKFSTDPSESTLVPGGNWRIWPFYFSRSRSRKGIPPIFNDIRNSSVENGLERDDYANEDTNHFKRKVEKQKVRTYLPTSDQLASLNLVEGRNTIAFTFCTKMLGKQEVDARIYLWKWNTRIVISDVDGTITKSDVLGQFMPMVGMDWSQTGVAHLFTAIKENGYQMLFLSARAISQAYITRQFLFNLKQDGKALPEGPVVISPDGLFPSLYREVIRRAPHEFKIACLENIRELFPADCNPFYAGFGNRDTDEISYLKVGIPIGKIFIINPKGEITVNRRVDSKSYSSLHDLVHGIFPPIDSTEQEDFNSWNYWKLPTVYLDL